MVEFFLGIGFGYFLGRIASDLAKPKLDMLLSWDPDVFAWRACSQSARMDTNKKYVAATRVYPQEDEATEKDGWR